MQPDLILEGGHERHAHLTPAWRSTLVYLGVCWIGLIAAFASDWGRITGQWWNSSTYNHMLFVPLMVGWLIWQRRGALAELAPTPWLPGLALVATVLIGWVLGALSGFDLLRQAAVVALLPSSLLVIAGPHIFAGLLFPLFYMTFMVPFGDELVPLLQMITARLTIALVNLSAVPAAIDGVYIDTPAGLFEVAEACSGVKFLIAMIALGVFVSHVGFRSWHRRAAFLALCLAAPILGNAVRAFATILVAQYVGAERAGGVDHLIYGWVFFALIVALVMGLAWRHFDRAADDPMIDSGAIGASRLLGRLQGRPVPAIAPTIAVAALVVLALGWAKAADIRVAPLAPIIDLPQVEGWHRVDYAPAYPWQPRATGAAHHLIGRYADSRGRRVDVFYALYAVQREGQEASAFGEGALPSNSGWSWQGSAAPSDRARADRLRAANGTRRLALTYYRTGDLLTGSNAALRLASLQDRALLRTRPTAMLILSGEAIGGRDPAAGLAAFRAAIGPVGPWMDRIGQGR